ncbi:unnamed protein product [Schistosoma curassoni]|uniref:Uncharacterized protein n=1 Tax=Schistosoma curassoni TaxID=6186 RepID=A0A183JVU8_9TREM|nr:unnamed protein product [Schistosoma curassoni]
MRAQNNANIRYKSNRETGHGGEHEFGTCSSSGKFHSHNSCVFLNDESLKCSAVAYIWSVCRTTLSIATNDEQNLQFGF